MNLHYPDILHDAHQDFSLASTKEKNFYESLGEKQQEVLEMIRETKEYSQSTKMIQSLSDKKNYTVHYITIKLYVSLAMQVRTIHRVSEFKQSFRLKPYLQLNTEKREESRNKIEKSFFKLMNSSYYGKTLESKRKRSNLQLVTNSHDLLRRTDLPTFCKFLIFNENLAAISSKKRSILWNQSTKVGATVLDLAKIHMFKFHYNVIKNHFNCSVLCSDTDSLLYEIKHLDFFEEIATNDDLRQHFDLSNFPADHHLFNTENKMVTLKFKDELGGVPIEEFVGLKPKMYSISAGGRQKLSAKGVCRYAQKALTHDVNKKSIADMPLYQIVEHENRINEAPNTNNPDQQGVSQLLFLLEDDISTLLHGHYMIRDVHITQDITDDQSGAMKKNKRCQQALHGMN